MVTLLDSTFTQYANLNYSINLEEYGTTVANSSFVSAVVLENLTPSDEVFDQLTNSTITKTSESVYTITGFYGEDIEYKPVIRTTDGNAPEDVQTYRTFEAANTATYKHVIYYYPEIFSSKTIEYTFDVFRLDEFSLPVYTQEQYDVIVYANINRHAPRVKNLVTNQTFKPTEPNT